MTRVIAILETMWDWRSMTSEAGYEEAVPYFRINPENFTGRRLYWFLGGMNASLVCTNACRELVTGPEHHGKPDPEWLQANLRKLLGMTEAECMLLVCGNVAQGAYCRLGMEPRTDRTIFMPHPAARGWNRKMLARARMFIQEGSANLHMRFKGGKLSVRGLTDV